jgi:hypothetical protein
MTISAHDTDDNGLSAPNTKCGRLQRACLELLQQHERDDALPTSNRFIFYELVQRGIISKHSDGVRRADQDMTDALFQLRDRGVIPWDWITDETRTFSGWRYAANVAAYLADSVDSARIDLWGGERPPAIITESRSLAGVLSNLAYQYLAPISATNGQTGGHLRTGIAPRLTAGQRVLYLGDLDLCGGQIEDNTRSVLERLVGELRWERLAITQDQARGLPAISKPDRRYKPIRFHDAVETEALGQSVIVGIVRDRLDALLPEPIETVLEREEAQRREVAAMLEEARQ